MWKLRKWANSLNLFWFFLSVQKLYIQGLALTRHMLYHLTHDPNPFCTNYFSEFLALFSGLTLVLNPPPYSSHVAGIIDVNTHAQLVCWDIVSLSFAPAGLNLWCSWSLPCSRWDYRCEPPQPTSTTSSKKKCSDPGSTEKTHTHTLFLI
jgi:hypothetical protein